MELFSSIMKMELLAYRRNKLYYFTGIILFLYLLLGGYHFLRGNYIEAGVMLQGSSYINMSAAMLGLFSGIMAGRRDKTAHFQEVLSSLPGDLVRPYAKMCAWFIVSIILTLLGYMDVLVLFKMADSEYLLFNKEILTYVIIYWGIPLFSCGVLGYFLESAISSNRLLIPVALFLWLIISPFNMILYPVLPERVLQLLNVGENDAQAYYDEYSGLHISGNYIKNALVFLLTSIALFISEVAYKKRDETGRRQKYTMLVVILLTMLFTCLLFNSMNWTEHAEDSIYYGALDNIPVKRSGNRGLLMESCNIKISFTENSCSYIAQEYISNIYDRRIPFTLYHGLEVISVKAEDKNIDFERKGDILYLTLPEGMEQSLITFEVRGSTGNLFPIYENAVYISSTFPWYPVPGEFVIAQKGFPYGDVEFKNLELEEPAKFHVKIEGNDQFYSNLEEVSKNEFQGLQKGVSLFKGMLISKNINGIEYIVPPDRVDDIISKMPEIQGKISYISEIIERPAKKVPEKIFVKPEYSSFHQYNYIFAQDHITASFSRYSTLNDIKGVFRSFYWNDIYREADNAHAYIFEIVLEYMEEPEKEYSYINIFATENRGDNSEFLQELSTEIIKLHKLNSEYLKELLRDMYGEIEKNPELPLSYWLDKIDELKEKG